MAQNNRSGSDPLVDAASGAAMGGAVGGPLGAVAGGAVGLLGGILGGQSARRQERQADRLRREALAQYEGIDLPDYEKMRLYLQDLEQVGELDPKLMGQIDQLGPSAMEGVEVDPRLRDAQLQALEYMQELGTEGLTQGEMAQLRQIQRQAQAQQQAQQQSILQEMAQRGMGGSGVELAARLAAAEGGSGMAAEQFDRAAQMAQQRALEGMMQSGQLGGQIRSQEFGEQSEAARAADIIDQFNLSQRLGHRSADVDRLNQAQAANLAEQQRIADAAIGNRNIEAQQRIQLPGMRFQDELAIADRTASVLGGQAGQHDARAPGRAQSGVDAGVGAGQIITALPGLFNDANKNKGT